MVIHEMNLDGCKILLNNPSGSGGKITESSSSNKQGNGKYLSTFIHWIFEIFLNRCKIPLTGPDVPDGISVKEINRDIKDSTYSMVNSASNNGEQNRNNNTGGYGGGIPESSSGNATQGTAVNPRGTQNTKMDLDFICDRETRETRETR